MKEYLYRLVAEYLLDSDVKARRANLRERVLLWFCILCFIVFVVLVTRAHATEIPVHVVEEPQVKMRLLSTPCVDPISLSLIATAPPQWADRWKAISSDWLQKDGTWGAYAGCWLEVKKEEIGTPDDVFVLVFADGATAQVFRSDLLKKAGPGA